MCIRDRSPGVGDIGEKMKWLDDFLSQGGGAYVDIIGGHFYSTGSNPESVLYLIKDARQVMAKYNISEKPLWNTEAGWWIANEDGTPEDPVSYTHLYKP